MHKTISTRLCVDIGSVVTTEDAEWLSIEIAMDSHTFYYMTHL